MKYLRILMLLLLVVSFAFAFSTQTTFAQDSNADQCPSVALPNVDEGCEAEPNYDDDEECIVSYEVDCDGDDDYPDAEDEDDADDSDFPNKDRVQDRIQDRDQRIEDNLRNRVEKILERITRHMQVAANRLTHIAGRISTRIDKIEERTDLDLSEAKGFVGDALVKVDEGLGQLGELEEAITSALDSDNPRETLKSTVKAIMEDIKADYHEARSLLRQAIESVKAALPDQNDTDSDESDENTDSE